MQVRVCRKTYQMHTPRKKGPGNIHTRGRGLWYMKIRKFQPFLTHVSFSVFVCCIPLRKCVTHAIYRDFLALKIEEKNISDCQILETKSTNIVYLILPCIRHYIKVGFNGIYVKANVQLSCKLT